MPDVRRRTKPLQGVVRSRDDDVARAAEVTVIGPSRWYDAFLGCLVDHTQLSEGSGNYPVSCAGSPEEGTMISASGSMPRGDGSGTIRTARDT